MAAFSGGSKRFSPQRRRVRRDYYFFLVLREFLCALCVSAVSYFLLVPNFWTLSLGLEFEGIYLGCKKS
jgi:hypothetical protein